MHDRTRLTSIGPVEGFYINAERSASGWNFHTRHKHYGGTWTDCEMVVGALLTTGEMRDMLDCILNDLVAVFGPGDWPDQP